MNEEIGSIGMLRRFRSSSRSKVEPVRTAAASFQLKSCSPRNEKNEDKVDEICHMTHKRHTLGLRE